MDADGSSNPEDIAGAASQTYTPVVDDKGRRLRVTVRFADDRGNPEELSALSDPVAAPENVPAAGLVLGGEAQVGRTLTAVTGGITDGNGLTPPVSFGYRWTRVEADGASNPEDIAGAESQTYTPVADDEGRRLRVTVSFDDDGGNPEELSALSDAVAPGVAAESRAVEGNLARFGEAATGQVLDGMRQRFEAPAAPGVQTTFAGQRVAWSPANRGPDREGIAANTVRTLANTALALDALGAGDLLAGSSFLLSGETANGGYASVWTRGAYGAYAGEEDGLEIDGSVRTGQIGADWSSGPWMLGLSVARSVGESGYRGAREGEIETALTGIYPYARYRFTERNSVWAAAGRGEGSLTLTPKGEGSRGPVKTDIDLTMGAAGLRVEMLEEGEGEDDGAAAGISLAVKADAAFVSMGSQEVAGRLSATSPDTNRVRVGLEGSRRIEAGNGAALIPSAEIGLRHDDGSLSAGTAADVGAGIVYRDPAHGWSVDFRARSLVAHEASGVREWGVAGLVRYDADPATERGFSASLDSGYGAPASGGTAALFALDRLEDMDAAGGTFPGGRVNAEAGYGLRAFGNGFTGRPSVRLGLAEAGFAWRLGWWVAPARPRVLNLRGGIDLDPRGGAYDIGVRLDARF